MFQLNKSENLSFNDINDIEANIVDMKNNPVTQEIPVYTPIKSDVKPDLHIQPKTLIQKLIIYGLFGLCGLCGLLLAIGLIGAIITYLVFIIMSLCETSYSAQKDMCRHSNAWSYLLSDLIVSLVCVLLLDTSNNQDSNSPICTILIISLGFTIWGTIELFGVSCVSNLNSTLLYTMLQVQVIYSIIINGIFLLLMCGGNTLKN